MNDVIMRDFMQALTNMGIGIAMACAALYFGMKIFKKK